MIANTNKDDRSPLTAADLAAHRILVDGLQALTPQIPVLSEESANLDVSRRRAWSRYWCVDPLDGTREFVKRNGEFTVVIALIDAGRSVLGVVQAPVSGELAWAWSGGGAWIAQGRKHGRVESEHAAIPCAWMAAVRTAIRAWIRCCRRWDHMS